MLRTARFILASLLVAFFLATEAAWGADWPTLLFDEGHGQKFLIEDSGRLQLTGLAEIFRSQGFRVAARSVPLTDAALAEVDALVLSGPFRPYTAEEVTAISRFVDRGGRLAVMLHIGMPVAELLEQLGVGVSPGVIHDPDQAIDGDPLNFRVTQFAPHRLFAGVERFSLYGVWAVTNTKSNATVIAATGHGAWIGLGDNRRLPTSEADSSFGVAVAGHYGHGRFVVFGDDAVFQNGFLDDDNRRLARNLSVWLKQP
jgi:hypothetical protein